MGLKRESLDAGIKELQHQKEALNFIASNSSDNSIRESEQQ